MSPAASVLLSIVPGLFQGGSIGRRLIDLLLAELRKEGMADDDDWETAWDSGAAEAQLEAEAKNDPEKRKKINEEIWQAANVPMPQIRRANQPVNTSYNPGLQILKRPTQSPSPTPSLSAPTKQEEEARRLERERKYEEARGRIFGSQSPAPETVVTTKAGEKKVWDPSVKDKEPSRGGVPIRGPRGPGEGRGFASARGGRRE